MSHSNTFNSTTTFGRCSVSACRSSAVLYLVWLVGSCVPPRLPVAGVCCQGVRFGAALGSAGATAAVSVGALLLYFGF